MKTNQHITRRHHLFLCQLLATVTLVLATALSFPSRDANAKCGDEDEMQASFTKSSVSSLSSHHYVIELHRADTSSGTFTNNDTESVTVSPAEFESIDRSKAYKARAKRCKTSSGKACGPWSTFSTTWVGPAPPTGISLSLTNPNTLTATYTRSTSAGPSTHRYQFKLTRSETSGGTYTDYGNVVKTTSTVDFQTVHTGYHYKAVGRRCKTENADCGEWSTASAAVNVPETDADPLRVASTTLSTQGDDITVNLTSQPESNGPSGQAVTPDPAPVVTHNVAELRRSKRDTGTYTSYRFANASATKATFTDVDTGWHYKARTRSCATADRKLCGEWSALSVFRFVPVPQLPTLTRPTLKPNGNGVMTAEFTLPSTAFTYQLKLESSEGKGFTRASKTLPLRPSRSSHDFTKLDPYAELLYRVSLTACTKADEPSCTSALSSPVRLPVLQVSATNLTAFGLGLTSSVSISAKFLPTDKDFTIKASTENEGADANILKFNACEADTEADPVVTPVDVETEAITGRPTTASISDLALFGCSEGTDSLTVTLTSGTKQYHTRTITTTVGPVPKPENLRANGSAPASSSSGRVAFRFDAIQGATGFVIEYVNILSPIGRVRQDITESERNSENLSAPSSGDLVFTGLVKEKLYEVKLRTTRNGFMSDWSDTVYVYSTSSRPGLGSIGDILVDSYMPTSHYEYTICRNTFPDVPAGTRDKWVADIERGIAKWASSAVWRDGSGINIVRASADSTPTSCATTGKEPWKGTSEVRYLTNQQEVMQACGADVPNACVLIIELNSDETSAGSLVPRVGNRSPYMIFNGQFEWDPGDVPDGKQCSKVENFAVHETGHVFGLGHVNPVTSVIDSVMNSLYEQRDGCEPTAHDISTLMSIYQSNQSP